MNTSIKKRYETKFSVTSINFHEIEHILKTHPAVFKKIFYKRNVNNIYFDNIDLSSYRDNIEGEKYRRKVRIRWYGNLFGECKEPKLEVKNKSGPLGWKERHKLTNFTINDHMYFDYKSLINNLIKAENFDVLKLNLPHLRPTLLNRYERSYYLSADKKYRVTLDTNMQFYSINPVLEFFKTYSDEEKTVVELKYDQEDLDGVDKITQSFPFRITKNSKYVIGIDRIRNWK